MRQRTLGLIGGVLLVAGIALNVGAEVAAQKVAPGAPNAARQPHVPGGGEHFGHFPPRPDGPPAGTP